MDDTEVDDTQIVRRPPRKRARTAATSATSAARAKWLVRISSLRHAFSYHTTHGVLVVRAGFVRYSKTQECLVYVDNDQAVLLECSAAATWADMQAPRACRDESATAPARVDDFYDADAFRAALFTDGSESDSENDEDYDDETDDRTGLKDPEAPAVVVCSNFVERILCDDTYRALFCVRFVPLDDVRCTRVDVYWRTRTRRVRIGVAVQSHVAAYLHERPALRDGTLPIALFAPGTTDEASDANGTDTAAAEQLYAHWAQADNMRPWHVCASFGNGDRTMFMLQVPRTVVHELRAQGGDVSLAAPMSLREALLEALQHDAARDVFSLETACTDVTTQCALVHLLAHVMYFLNMRVPLEHFLPPTFADVYHRLHVEQQWPRVRGAYAVSQQQVRLLEWLRRKESAPYDVCRVPRVRGIRIGDTQWRYDGTSRAIGLWTNGAEDDGDNGDVDDSDPAGVDVRFADLVINCLFVSGGWASGKRTVLLLRALWFDLIVPPSSDTKQPQQYRGTRHGAAAAAAAAAAASTSSICRWRSATRRRTLPTCTDLLGDYVDAPMHAAFRLVWDDFVRLRGLDAQELIDAYRRSPTSANRWSPLFVRATLVLCKASAIDRWLTCASALGHVERSLDNESVYHVYRTAPPQPAHACIYVIRNRFDYERMNYGDLLAADTVLLAYDVVEARRRRRHLATTCRYMEPFRAHACAFASSTWMHRVRHVLNGVQFHSIANANANASDVALEAVHWHRVVLDNYERQPRTQVMSRFVNAMAYERLVFVSSEAHNVYTMRNRLFGAMKRVFSMHGRRTHAVLYSAFMRDNARLCVSLRDHVPAHGLHNDTLHAIRTMRQQHVVDHVCYVHVTDAARSAYRSVLDACTHLQHLQAVRVLDPHRRATAQRTERSARAASAEDRLSSDHRWRPYDAERNSNDTDDQGDAEYIPLYFGGPRTRAYSTFTPIAAVGCTVARCIPMHEDDTVLSASYMHLFDDQDRAQARRFCLVHTTEQQRSEALPRRRDVAHLKPTFRYLLWAVLHVPSLCDTVFSTVTRHIAYRSARQLSQNVSDTTTPPSHTLATARSQEIRDNVTLALMPTASQPSQPSHPLQPRGVALFQAPLPPPPPPPPPPPAHGPWHLLDEDNDDEVAEMVEQAAVTHTAHVLQQSLNDDDDTDSDDSIVDQPPPLLPPPPLPISENPFHVAAARSNRSATRLERNARRRRQATHADMHTYRHLVNGRELRHAQGAEARSVDVHTGVALLDGNAGGGGDQHRIPLHALEVLDDVRPPLAYMHVLVSADERTLCATVDCIVNAQQRPLLSGRRRSGASAPTPPQNDPPPCSLNNFAQTIAHATNAPLVADEQPGTVSRRINAIVRQRRSAVPDNAVPINSVVDQWFASAAQSMDVHRDVMQRYLRFVHSLAATAADNPLQQPPTYRATNSYELLYPTRTLDEALERVARSAMSLLERYTLTYETLLAEKRDAGEMLVNMVRMLAQFVDERAPARLALTDDERDTFVGSPHLLSFDDLRALDAATLCELVDRHYEFYLNRLQEAVSEWQVGLSQGITAFSVYARNIISKFHYESAWLDRDLQFIAEQRDRAQSMVDNVNAAEVLRDQERIVVSSSSSSTSTDDDDDVSSSYETSSHDYNCLLCLGDVRRADTVALYPCGHYCCWQCHSENNMQLHDVEDENENVVGIAEAGQRCFKCRYILQFDEIVHRVRLRDPPATVGTMPSPAPLPVPPPPPPPPPSAPAQSFTPLRESPPLAASAAVAPGNEASNAAPADVPVPPPPPAELPLLVETSPLDDEQHMCLKTGPIVEYIVALLHACHESVPHVAIVSQSQATLHTIGTTLRDAGGVCVFDEPTYNDLRQQRDDDDQEPTVALYHLDTYARGGHMDVVHWSPRTDVTHLIVVESPCVRLVDDRASRYCTTLLAQRVVSRFVHEFSQHRVHIVRFVVPHTVDEYFDERAGW